MPEYWIGPGAATSNLGTLAQPFDGSTASKFDDAMERLPTNSVIHLLPGVFQTEGFDGWSPKSGQKLKGAGMDVTTVQLASGALDHDTVIMNRDGNSGSQGIEVQDMTVDCNYTGGDVHYNGVILWGANMAIRRVKVINGVGLTGEAFLLCLMPGATNSVGNMIEECEVSQFRGGGVSAINIGGNDTSWISATVRNNRVFLTPVSGHAAINGSWVYNYLVEGNYVEGAGAGLYSDTGTFTNLILSHNTFKNVLCGCMLRNGARINSSLVFNTIELADIPQSRASGFSFYGGMQTTNVSIIGNTVRYVDGTSKWGGYSVAASGVTGLRVTDNSFDSSLTTLFDGTATNVSMFNNFDLSGNPLASLDQPQNVVANTLVATGNVGIGTATPEYSLDVNGSIRASSLILDATNEPGDVLMSDGTGKAVWQPLRLAAGAVRRTEAVSSTPSFNEQSFIKNVPFTVSLTAVEATNTHGVYPALTVPAGMTFIATGMAVETSAKTGRPASGALVSLGSSDTPGNIVASIRLSPGAEPGTLYYAPKINASAIPAGKQVALSSFSRAPPEGRVAQTLTVDVTGFFR